MIKANKLISSKTAATTPPAIAPLLEELLELKVGVVPLNINTVGIIVVVVVVVLVVLVVVVIVVEVITLVLWPAVAVVAAVIRLQIA